MNLLDGLNERQKEAVINTEGPIMVMAGAGSGKTKVLTTRISYLIKELGVNPYNILAVTFTNKAANEMKERIAKNLDMDTKWMWISTFHSFCARVLRDEIDNLEGYRRGFQIIDDDDQLKILKEIKDDTELDFRPKEMSKLISKYKNDIKFNFFEERNKDTFNEVNKKYSDYLVKNNLFDFDDLILKTIELFKKNPNVLERYQEKFQYILVDEFQDTNTPQYNLVFMLSTRHHNIFIVGDDFQSIYSFRGAKIENIRRFKNDFLEHKLILLEKNYRSTTEILNLANDCITHNPNQIKKVLESNNKSGKKPLYYPAKRTAEEIAFIVDNIKKINISGVPYKEIAVLYRANYLSRELEDAFIKAKIPYKIYGGVSFFSRKEIKDMIAYLQIIINHNQDFSFKRIINEPKRKIGGATLEKLAAVAERMNLSLYDAIDFYESKSQGAINLVEFKKTIDTIYNQIENVRLPDLIDIILKETGYKEEMKKEEDPDIFNDRMDNIQEFKSVLLEAEDYYEEETKKKLLEALLADLTLRTDKNDTDNNDSVRLSTYHQVKGLEFDTVFMYAMNEGIFPSDMIVSDAEMEEERRICYVGITRSKNHLFLSSSESRVKFGSMDYFSESRFIKEMKRPLLDIFNPYNIKTEFTKPQVKLETKKEEKVTSDITLGDKINHKLFGDGVVVSQEGDVIKVAFSAKFGIKTLKASHPAIRKL